MTPTDEELAERAKRGDQEAFAALVTGHQKRMYGLALKMLRNPDDAADAAQEAFVRCYASLDRYDAGQSFGAWLYRIGYNHCLDVLRRRRRAPMARGSPDKIDYALEHAPDPGPGVEEMAERNLSVEELDAALDLLPDDYRHILTLRYTLDLAYDEMAETLGVPQSTVTMRLHRAKRALRVQLATCREGPDAAS